MSGYKYDSLPLEYHHEIKSFEYYYDLILKNTGIKITREIFDEHIENIKNFSYIDENLNSNYKNINNCYMCTDIFNSDNCVCCTNIIDCKKCENCKGCGDCENCENCEWCTNCENCKDCKDCKNCKDCKDCKTCFNTKNCIKCEKCDGCENSENISIYNYDEY